jgi:hypothetical protein
MPSGSKSRTRFQMPLSPGRRAISPTLNGRGRWPSGASGPALRRPRLHPPTLQFFALLARVR